MAFPALIAGGALLGCAVQSRAGEKLGSICELMLDPASGCLAYAVLSYGGVIGVGEKLFAVPWRQFGFDEESRTLLLDVTPGQLEAAPGFDKDAWPARADEDWLAGLPAA
jgi:PRC-barrel domain protein